VDWGDSKICELSVRIAEYMAAGSEGLQAANKQGSKVSATEPLAMVGSIVFQSRVRIVETFNSEES
jgi:hypothetical protein